MNEQEKKRGEQIAAKIMKALALIGLVAILGLAAWFVVVVVRFVPNADERLSAAVTGVTSIFRSAPVEGIAYVLEERSLTSGNEYQLTWEYTGANAPTSYSWSYACADSATFDVREGDGWITVPCGTPRQVEGTSLTVIPTSKMNRFLDVALVIEANEGALRDTTLVTLVNESVSESRAVYGDDGASTSTPGVSEVTTTLPSTEPATTTLPAPTPAAPAPVVVAPVPPRDTTPNRPAAPAPAPVVTPIQPVVTGPADLAVDIKELGVVERVSGRSIFFPISPIPNNRVAAVKFTVTNKGGMASGPWGFVANLPIEGDADYRYTSPLQASLPPNAQVEFTLSFDEVLDAKNGAIRITLKPSQNTDRAANNVDAILVAISQK